MLEHAIQTYLDGSKRLGNYNVAQRLLKSALKEIRRLKLPRHNVRDWQDWKAIGKELGKGRNSRERCNDCTWSRPGLSLDSAFCVYFSTYTNPESIECGARRAFRITRDKVRSECRVSHLLRGILINAVEGGGLVLKRTLTGEEFDAIGFSPD